MFNPIFNALAGLLSFFYSVVPSYAAAIALLTATVMLLCFPLTAKATRSMAKMAKLQPEIRRIQQRNKNDRQKQTEETTALFREHNVSPFGGCLPILVQGPVFLIMYRILFGLTRRRPDGTFRPSYLSETSELYQALNGARTMKSFGVDLAITASQVVRSSAVRALPYFVLLAGVVATGYYQQRQITKRNPPPDPANDNPYVQTMQRMTKIYPIMYLVMGFTLPAGINIYFLVSNLFRIAQQGVIYKLDPTLGAAPASLGKGANDPPPKGLIGGEGASTDGSAKRGGKPKAAKGKDASTDGSAKRGGKPKAAKGKDGAGSAEAKRGGGTGKPGSSRGTPGSNGKPRGGPGSQSNRRPAKKRRGR